MENQEEVWKDVVGSNGEYVISNSGIIKSLKFGKERILKQSTQKGGYLFVSISLKGKKTRTRCVHQLVAESFFGHIPCGMELVVEHKNHIIADNRIENLEIITQRQNADQKHLKSSSNYTGVHAVLGTNSFIAQIVFNKKRVYLGSFTNEKEANMYYKNAKTAIKNNTLIIVKKPNYSSEHKGVIYCNYFKKWISFIYNNGKKERLGSFDSEQEALKYRENAMISIKNNTEIIYKKKVKTSNYKGVSWDNKNNKWQVSAKINGKQKHLGRFDNEIDAYEVYKKNLIPKICQ